MFSAAIATACVTVAASTLGGPVVTPERARTCVTPTCGVPHRGAPVDTSWAVIACFCAIGPMPTSGCPVVMFWSVKTLPKTIGAKSTDGKPTFILFIKSAWCCANVGVPFVGLFVVIPFAVIIDLTFNSTISTWGAPSVIPLNPIT